MWLRGDVHCKWLLNGVAMFAGHVQSGPPREEFAIPIAAPGHRLSDEERDAVVEKMVKEGRL